MSNIGKCEICGEESDQSFGTGGPHLREHICCSRCKEILERELLALDDNEPASTIPRLVLLFCRLCKILLQTLLQLLLHLLHLLHPLHLLHHQLLEHLLHHVLLAQEAHHPRVPHLLVMAI